MQKAGSQKKEYIVIKSRKYSILLILLVTIGSLYAQDKDAGLWTGVEVEKEINKWLDLQGAFEIRIHNNISRVEKYLGEAGLSARLNKYLDAGVTYRYSYRYLPEFDWFPVHRIYTDLRAEYEWTVTSVSLRFRFTADKIPGFREEGIIETTARLRPQIAYNIRKTPLRVRGSVEFFFPVWQEQTLITEKIRYKLGLQYVISRSVTLELTYLYQNGTYKNKPKNNFIWVARLNYKF
jgi:hypothetical protein